MQRNIKISLITLLIIVSLNLYGQRKDVISFQKKIDTNNVVHLSFFELYDGFEKFIGKTVELGANIDFYTENSWIRPTIKEGQRNKKIWYNLPENIPEKDKTRLYNCTGMDVKVIAIVVGLPKNIGKVEGKGNIILLRVVLDKKTAL